MATNTGLKYIICDVATKDHGKTTFLKIVANLLKAHRGSKVTVLAKRWHNDECFLWTDLKTGKTILVQTKGDDAPSFAYSLNYLATHNVDIILCARHNHGQTKDVVEQIANQYNYEELDFTHMYPQSLNWSLPSTIITHNLMSQCIYNILLSL